MKCVFTFISIANFIGYPVNMFAFLFTYTARTMSRYDRDGTEVDAVYAQVGAPAFMGEKEHFSALGKSPDSDHAL